MKYYAELKGNARKITAILNDSNKKAQNMPKIHYPLIVGESVKEIEFTYGYNHEKNYSYVKFSVHKFVNTKVIDALIKVSETLLER